MSLRRPLVLVNGLMRALPTGDRTPLSELGARVFRNSNQSIPNSTGTPIIFSGARYDNGSFWSASNPTRLTVSVAGKYLIGGVLDFGTSTTGNRAATIRLNGATPIASSFGAALLRPCVSTVWDMQANDYLELTAFQDSGTALNTIYMGSLSPEFWIQRIGE